MAGIAPARWMMAPPPRPVAMSMGTPDRRSRSRSRATVRSATPNSAARAPRVIRCPLACNRSMRCCCRSTRRSVRWLSREFAATCALDGFTTESNHDTVVSGLLASVATMSENDTVNAFFEQYSNALLKRDQRAVADLYAVPALILFPGQSIPVSDSTQTEQFFAAAWEQYDGVTATSTEIAIVAETGHSIWADVTWRHDNGSTERLMYQLVDTGEGWKIAVLTPLEQR